MSNDFREAALLRTETGKNYIALLLNGETTAPLWSYTGTTLNTVTADEIVHASYSRVTLSGKTLVLGEPPYIDFTSPNFGAVAAAVGPVKACVIVEDGVNDAARLIVRVYDYRSTPAGSRTPDGVSDVIAPIGSLGLIAMPDARSL